MRNDRFYHLIIRLVRGVFRAQDLNFTITGEENLPTGGAVVVANHTGYLDFTYVGIPFWEQQRRVVRFMAKAEVWKNPIGGPVMRGMRHIPVDRIDTESSYNTAVEYLKQGELVGIFPEGTVSRSLEIKKLRTGAVRMAREAGVPIVPVMLIGSQRVWPKWGKKNLGRSHTPIDIRVLPAWTPPEDADIHEATQQLHDIMAEGLTQMWETYATNHGPLPAGAEWIPARFGGSAMTLEQAQAIDDATVKERRRVRSLRDDLDRLADKVQNVIQTVGTASKELVVQSAENTAAGAQATAATTRNLLEQLADDATTGAKEGAAKLASAGDRLKELAAQIPTSVPPTAVEALNSVIADAKQIRDRLPHRIGARGTTLPAAVVTDIDGTIAYEGQVSQAVKDTFTQLRDLGVDVILATGRAPEELPDILTQLPFAPTVICANGALVVDGEKILANPNNPDAILHAQSFDKHTATHVTDAINAARTSAHGTDLAQLTTTADTVGGHVVKITVHAPAPAPAIADLLNEHLDTTQAQATYSNSYGYAEIAPAGTTKATGLAWVLAEKGIKANRVTAFGDMRNDKEMLDMVGTGVAMGRGDADLIMNANWVTTPVDLDGVPAFLAPILEHATPEEK